MLGTFLSMKEWSQEVKKYSKLGISLTDDFYKAYTKHVIFSMIYVFCIEG